MVCDLFVDAYRAGQSCGDLAYNAARGTRACLIRKLGEVYAELEQESYHREQFETELMKANNEIANLRDLVAGLGPATTEASADAEGEALYDGDKFSEQDLPFPDVDDLAPASELLGGDE